jgi:hypothetical protein
LYQTNTSILDFHPFFFLNQQNFIKKQVSAQDKQRPVIHKVQTKGAVYRRNIDTDREIDVCLCFKYEGFVLAIELFFIQIIESLSQRQ